MLTKWPFCTQDKIWIQKVVSDTSWLWDFAHGMDVFLLKIHCQEKSLISSSASTEGWNLLTKVLKLGALSSMKLVHLKWVQILWTWICLIFLLEMRKLRARRAKSHLNGVTQPWLLSHHLKRGPQNGEAAECDQGWHHCFQGYWNVATQWVGGEAQ